MLVAERYNDNAIPADENKDFVPPKEASFNLPGKPLKDKMVKMLEKLYNDKDSNKVSCKPDGSYEITNRCPNKKPINSNYTKPEYDELMEYLTRVKKYTSK